MISVLRGNVVKAIIISAIVLPSMSFAGMCSLPDKDSKCRLVLCLANPEGPTKEKECKPDIRKMLKCQAEGDTIPKCKEAEAAGSYYRSNRDHYAKCTGGLIDSRDRSKEGHVGENVFIVKRSEFSLLSIPKDLNKQTQVARELTKKNYVNNPSVRPYGPGKTDLACVGGGSSKEKICVKYGQISDRHWGCETWGVVIQYEKVDRKPYRVSPEVFDVYIDRKFWHRTRLYGGQDPVDEIESKNY